jgi:hypothetical protein
VIRIVSDGLKPPVDGVINEGCQSDAGAARDGTATIDRASKQARESNRARGVFLLVMISSNAVLHIS